MLLHLLAGGAAPGVQAGGEAGSLKLAPITDD
jgi:hypothetical protein